jgi:hypothetical protein
MAYHWIRTAKIIKKKLIQDNHWLSNVECLLRNILR